MISSQQRVDLALATTLQSDLKWPSLCLGSEDTSRTSSSLRYSISTTTQSQSWGDSHREAATTIATRGRSLWLATEPLKAARTKFKKLKPKRWRKQVLKNFPTLQWISLYRQTDRILTLIKFSVLLLKMTAVLRKNSLMTRFLHLN